MASRALPHDFLFPQLSLLFELFDASSFLRKNLVANVAVAQGELMHLVGERHRPASSSWQHHFFGPFVDLRSCCKARDRQANDNDREKSRLTHEESS
jgi:hypothetical protein